MDDYPSLDPYVRSRYDQGIDSKIVIMGNSGIVLLHRVITSMRLLSFRRSWQDQPPLSIYPEQVRPKEYHLHKWRLFCYEKGLCQRCQSPSSTLGHRRPGEI